MKQSSHFPLQCISYEFSNSTTPKALKNSHDLCDKLPQPGQDILGGAHFATTPYQTLSISIPLLTKSETVCRDSTSRMALPPFTSLMRAFSRKFRTEVEGEITWTITWNLEAFFSQAPGTLASFVALNMAKHSVISKHELRLPGAHSWACYEMIATNKTLDLEEKSILSGMIVSYQL